MRHLLLAFTVVAAAAPAFAQEEWQDLGEATLEDDGLKDAEDEPALAPPPAQPPAASGEIDSMKLVSAGTAAALLAFAGTGVGIGAAFTTGALFSLMPNANTSFRVIEVPVWLAFWTLPVMGAAGGAAFGALPYMEPTGVGVVSAAAAGGAGLGALLGWGFGFGIASLLHGAAPGVAFPNTSKPAWSATMGTGVLLGAGLGAATGAAVAAPFFVPGVLEAMTKGAEE